jgi:hypothetical protein
MGLIVTAVAAVVGATIAIFVDRNIQNKKRLAKTVGVKDQKDQTGEATSTETAPEEAQPSFMDRVTNWRKILTGNKQEVARKFQAWAENNIADAELKAWLLGLSPEAASALAEQLADFCANLGFELPWLLENSLKNDPEIEQEAISVVTAYCQSCKNAAQNNTDFELFKVLQKMENAPFARQHQDLSRQLFAELVKREMAPSVPAELFLASEKERQEHMTKAIQQAAQTNRDQFKRVLREVMAAEATSTSATPEAAQAATEGADDKQADESSKKRPFFAGGGRSKQKKTPPAASEPAPADTASSAPEPSAS